MYIYKKRKARNVQIPFIRGVKKYEIYCYLTFCRSLVTPLLVFPQLEIFYCLWCKNFDLKKNLLPFLVSFLSTFFNFTDFFDSYIPSFSCDCTNSHRKHKECVRIQFLVLYWSQNYLRNKFSKCFIKSSVKKKAMKKKENDSYK